MKDIRALFGDEMHSLPLVKALADRPLPKIRYRLFLETKRTLSEVLTPSTGLR